MTTKPLTSIKPVVGKDGKTRLVRKRTLFARAKELKAEREAAAWQKKTPPMGGATATESVVLGLGGRQ